MTLRWSIFDRKLSEVHREQFGPAQGRPNLTVRFFIGPALGRPKSTVRFLRKPYGSDRKLLKIAVRFYQKPYGSDRKPYGSDRKV